LGRTRKEAVVAKFEAPSLISPEGLRKTTINFAQEAEVRTQHIPNTCRKLYRLIQSVLSPKNYYFKIFDIVVIVKPFDKKKQPIV
jgi:hypothetical protein